MFTMHMPFGYLSMPPFFHPSVCQKRSSSKITSDKTITAKMTWHTLCFISGWISQHGNSVTRIRRTIPSWSRISHIFAACVFRNFNRFRCWINEFFIYLLPLRSKKMTFCYTAFYLLLFYIHGKHTSLRYFFY